MKNEEIYKWLESQKYQTEYEETGEYKMYFGVDMPKILNDFTKIELLSLLEDLSDYVFGLCVRWRLKPQMLN
jgi:hypothetical protein